MIHQQISPAKVDSQPSLQPATHSGVDYDTYGTLLMRLYAGDDRPEDHLHTIGITSCLHGEGVTTVAAQVIQIFIQKLKVS